MSLAVELAHADRIRLEARDEVRSVRRPYRIRVSMDLFGHTIVEWCWGTTGTMSQVRRRSFRDSEEAARHLRTLLHRRDTSPRWRGVACLPIDDRPVGGAIVAGEGSPFPLES